MNFNFSIGKIKRPTVSISKYGIKFNKEAIELLGSPKYISIGLDVKAKKLAFKASEEKNYKESIYDFVTSVNRQSGLIISAKEIREEAIKLMSEKSQGKGVYFLLELDEDVGFRVIDLSRSI
ncbi:MAG: hypothetical protein FWE03_02855 [Firmicutes bacterium]|nr:hypothetical protein [Bacillota bacterium]